MKTLILIAMVLAMWHYVYDGIIAPSIRQHLRNRLFALRDELREVQESELSKDDQAAFWFVHTGINNFLNRLPGITIDRSRKIQSVVEQDKERERIFVEHLNKVLNAENPVIRSVFKKTNDVLRQAMMTNSGGWFVYIVPIAASFVLMDSFSRLARHLLLAPASSIDKLFPSARRSHR
ncbi:hypothetical protein [Pandoraea sp. NPDC087047]|uniref:hypothetical protein n=1 Tax=Pandoraea sp. NPDC087047 TaxID=3364390 RepID=UPI00380CC540